MYEDICWGFLEAEPLNQKGFATYVLIDITKSISSGEEPVSPSKRVPLATQGLVTRFEFAKLMHETCVSLLFHFVSISQESGQTFH